MPDEELNEERNKCSRTSIGTKDRDERSGRKIGTEDRDGGS